MIPSVLLLVLSLAAAPPLSGWGTEGHRLVVRLVPRDLPAALDPWFAGQEQVLLRHCNDPDHWKVDPREFQRHFLSVEPYGNPGAVPTGSAEAMALLGPLPFQQHGQLPWTIQDRVLQLGLAFQQGDRRQAAVQTAVLSHYVADLLVPLHTTLNYDGQLTGRAGLHQRWEVGLVDRLVGPLEARPAFYQPGLWTAPWRWLAESNALVAALLADDLTAAAAPDYWQTFTRLQGPVVREQLVRAAQCTAELVLLAWTLAGRPGLELEGHGQIANHPS